MRSATKKKRKFPLLLLTLSILLIANPNFNTVDILPDFIAFLILARLSGRYSEYVPYFGEARTAFSRLALVTLIKVPAMFMMFSNMGSGRDIVPLFAFTFAALELMLLYPAIKNIFSALFYVGERGSMPDTIRGYRVCGINLTPEWAERSALIFVSIKAVASVLPELCLLTFDTDTTIMLLRAIYPTITVICLLIALAAGILWAIITIGYLKSIAHGGGIAEAAAGIAGEEKLSRLEREREMRKRLTTLTLLAASSVLTLDLTFDGVNNGVTIIPRCIYAIVAVLAVCLLTASKKERILLMLSGAIYTAVSLVSHKVLLDFGASYGFRDILDLAPAREAYRTVEIWATVELAAAILVAAVLAVVLARYFHGIIGTSSGSNGEGRAELRLRRSYAINGVALAVIPAIISLMKCLNTYFSGNVQLIFSDANDITQPVIAASSVPWFGTIIVAACIAYIFYAFYFISDVKGEIKLRFSEEASYTDN